MRQSLIFFVTFLLFSCKNNIENLENFQLLPVVQEFKFNNGFSNLNFKNLKYAHSTTNDELPVRSILNLSIESGEVPINTA